MLKHKLKITTITAQNVKVENGATVVTDLPTATTFMNTNAKNVRKRYIAECGEPESGFLVITSYKTETAVFEMSEKDFINGATKVTEI